MALFPSFFHAIEAVSRSFVLTISVPYSLLLSVSTIMSCTQFTNNDLAISDIETDMIGAQAAVELAVQDSQVSRDLLESQDDLAETSQEEFTQTQGTVDTTAATTGPSSEQSRKFGSLWGATLAEVDIVPGGSFPIVSRPKAISIRILSCERKKL
jgi:hypothetical protein